MTEETVRELTAYGIRHHLIEENDAMWAANTLMAVMKAEPSSDFNADHLPENIRPLEEILKDLLDDAVERGVIEDGTASRDLFDTKLMGVLTPRPSAVIHTFHTLYEESPEKATDYFYQLSCDSDYIRTYRVKKDKKWIAHTKYGDLDITINLSKPEKDPKAIAAAAKAKKDKYPKCALCEQNEGYPGRLDHPARETIRYIPLTLDGEPWFMQYSPYVYYNEHCIIFAKEHRPMKIERAAFTRLLEAVTLLPHYTVGSNADLPIVGGSILSHEHFQGGHYTFAMAKAGLRKKLTFKGYEDIEAGIVEWPLSVIRLDGKDPERLVDLAERILVCWHSYDDPSVAILSETDGVPHNTITPIARRKGELYELDLVLRNNRTTDEYPLGIFHPHQELHHIKKENIGLIEVMGLAVLPARLDHEMELVKQTVLQGKDVSSVPAIASHGQWMKEVLDRHPSFRPENVVNDSAHEKELTGILQDEIGQVFARVLENCGVFKDDEKGQIAFARFLHTADR